MSNKLYKEPIKKKKKNPICRLWLWFWEDVNPGSWKPIPRWMWWTVIVLGCYAIVELLLG